MILTGSLLVCNLATWKGFFIKANPSITLWSYLHYSRIKRTSWQTRISLCKYAPLGAKTILGHSHFENDSSPHISGSGSLIWIKIHFVRFKHVSLIWINYLETCSHWDNMFCYYTSLNHLTKMCQVKQNFEMFLLKKLIPNHFLKTMQDNYFKS